MAEMRPSPDDKHLFLLLLKLGLKEEEAYSFVQELQTMASANLIAQFQGAMEPKLDAVNARLEAQNNKLDMQNAVIDSKMRILLWVISMSVIVISAVVTLNTLLG